jgi:hypothetical protein
MRNESCSYKSAMSARIESESLRGKREAYTDRQRVCESCSYKSEHLESEGEVRREKIEVVLTPMQLRLEKVLRERDRERQRETERDRETERERQREREREMQVRLTPMQLRLEKVLTERQR